MHPVATYLRDLRDIRGSGSAVKETSYYPALAALLNAIGGDLRPRVRCILTLKNRGAGIPDGGLFTADQIGRDAPSDAFPAPLPARGVLEVKGPSDAVDAIAKSAQVQKYLDGYGQVLVTNYRDFLLVGRDAHGRPLPQERYTLAANEADFWRQVSDPTAFAEAHAERFAEYLKRVMLAAAPLTNPADVAWFLASYARDARVRIERSDLPALKQIRKALEEALGISFDQQRGDHFFRSTLIQTLFYGVFSAWVLWHHKDPERTDTFDWRLAQYYLHVPVLQALFNQVAAPQRLRPLGLMEVLEWTGAALNRVERSAFFARFDTGHAVQYFYEPFLEAFDPELRRELGVWYTPPEVVRYMVARVDQALREELGIADGLADPNVFVLDPCTGTGAYVAEVLRHIAATLRARGEDALLAQDVKHAALSRVFGFELLPAPFVVAHLQIGLLLQQLGAPLEEHERVGVYLTNALTGWEPPDEAKRAVQLRFPGLPELMDERDQAEQIKRGTPILVVIGNPPYSGFAGISQIDEERDLSNAYRTTKRAPKPQGQGLNDLYVRFFRMAERQIVETSKRGIVCYISNYSWLDGLSFTGMRERYLEAFDRIWIDSLNGDKYRTGKLTPEGDPDPSVFSTEFNREGIQVGTAIALMVRRERRSAPLPPTPSHSGQADAPLPPTPSPTGQADVPLPPTPSPTGQADGPLPPTPSPTRGEGEPEMRGQGGEGPEAVERWHIPESLRRKMIDVARTFRKEPTRSEAVLWEALRRKQLDGYKFRRQQPIGPFVVDFYCAEARLIVEVDGAIHEQQQEADANRQALLEALGLRFVRLSAAQVEAALPEALQIIRTALKRADAPLPPTPSHSGQADGPLPPTPSPTREEGESDAATPPLPAWERGQGGEGATPAMIHFRNLWGRDKRQQLLKQLDGATEPAYQQLQPPVALGLPLQPAQVAVDYLTWPLLTDLTPTYFAGVQTKRDEFVVDFDRSLLEKRIVEYFDTSISHDEIARRYPRVMEQTARFEPIETRNYLLKRGFLEDYIVHFCYRPFDVRWVYWEPETRLLGEKSPDYFPHVFHGNKFIVSQQKPRREWSLPQVIQSIGCLDLMDRGASCIPLYLRTSAQQRDMFDVAATTDLRDLGDGRRLNLSDAALDYVQSIGSIADAEALFYHSIAVLHAPAYRNENAGALRQDWPRIPLPATRELLLASAELGRRVAALLDSEQPVAGVTSGSIDEALRPIAVLSIAGGGQINPAGGDLDVTAGWGFAGRGGITMPGKGKTLERRAEGAEVAPGLGVVPDGKTLDVYLNERVYWRNVPPRVWNYTIGGYQVLKKWLSYRERPLLGRGLRVDEAREVTQIARRIAAILLLEPELDANYRAVAAATYADHEA
jgi:very-short-patch-repair endonuclease